MLWRCCGLRQSLRSYYLSRCPSLTWCCCLRCSCKASSGGALCLVCISARSRGRDHSSLLFSPNLQFKVAPLVTNLRLATEEISCFQSSRDKHQPCCFFLLLPPSLIFAPRSFLWFKIQTDQQVDLGKFTKLCTEVWFCCNMLSAYFCKPYWERCLWRFHFW